MNQNSEVVDLSNERFIQAVKVMILACQQEMTWVLNSEDLLELTFVVFDLCLVVYLDRTNIVQLNWEAKWSQKTYGS